LAPTQISKIAVKENTFVVTVINKKKLLKKLHCNFRSANKTLVLYEPSNMGNLGTIIRSMIGFDFTNLVFIGNYVDILDPTVLRSSMGAFFNLGIKSFDNFDVFFEEFSEFTHYSFDIKGEQFLKNCSPQSPFTIIFGNEGAGLPDNVLKKTTPIKIQHSNKIDSLNLAMSVSIALYQLGN
jgi:TrmH family RNA methyltransferase